MTFDPIQNNSKVKMLVNLLSPVEINKIMYLIKNLEFSKKENLSFISNLQKSHLTKNEKAVFDWKISK